MCPDYPSADQLRSGTIDKEEGQDDDGGDDDEGRLEYQHLIRKDEIINHCPILLYERHLKLPHKFRVVQLTLRRLEKT